MLYYCGWKMRFPVQFSDPDDRKMVPESGLMQEVRDYQPTPIDGLKNQKSQEPHPAEESAFVTVVQRSLFRIGFNM